MSKILENRAIKEALERGCLNHLGVPDIINPRLIYSMVVEIASILPDKPEPITVEWFWKNCVDYPDVINPDKAIKSINAHFLGGK